MTVRLAFLLGDFAPRVSQLHRAVKHQALRGCTFFVDAKVSQSLKLESIAGGCIAERRFYSAVAEYF